MQIKFDVTGLPKVRDFLSSLSRNLRKVGIDALIEYIIGNGQHGLKQYPPYKYVTRKRAYGQTFKSDKQRRYVMAKIRSGEIDPGYPHRTGRSQRGWQMVETGGKYQIVNPEVGAYYSNDDAGQARLNALVGWRKISSIIQSNMAGAIRHAYAAINAFITQKGK